MFDGHDFSVMYLWEKGKPLVELSETLDPDVLHEALKKYTFFYFDEKSLSENNCIGSLISITFESEDMDATVQCMLYSFGTFIASPTFRDIIEGIPLDLSKFRYISYNELESITNEAEKEVRDRYGDKVANAVKRMSTFSFEQETVHMN